VAQIDIHHVINVRCPNCATELEWDTSRCTKYGHAFTGDAHLFSHGWEQQKCPSCAAGIGLVGTFVPVRLS